MKFKKLLAAMLITAVALSSMFVLASCNNKPDEPNGDDGNPIEYEFVDYATEVYLNTEKYPELEDQGLFVVGYDETDGIYDEKAYSDKGVAMIDPEKPTLVLVHGWLGANFNETTGEAPQRIKPFWDFEMDNLPNYEGKCIIGELIKAGYNVLTFNYNRFSVHDIVSNEFWIYSGGTEKYPYAFMSDYNEAGTKEGVKGVVYCNNDICDYSLSQYLAAEYIRMVKAVGNDYGKAETRVIGHSLGGIMANVSTNILYELSKAGQLTAAQAPNRLALLDTYIGFLSEDDAYGNEIVAWSGEDFVDASPSDTYLSYIENMAQGGIAVEVYLAKGGIVPVMSTFGKYSSYVTEGEYKENDLKAYELLKNSAGVLCGTWPTDSIWMIDCHVEICKYYMCSILTGVKNVDGSEGLSGKLPTEKVKELMGKTFQTSDGTATADYGNFVVSESNRFNYGK